MTTASESAPWHLVDELIASGDPERLQVEIEQLGLREVARALSRLDDERQHQFLTMVSPEVAAVLLEEISDAQGAQLIAVLPAEAAASIVEAMSSNECVDLLHELEPEHAEQILEELPPESAGEIRKRARYEDDVAGGLMITEYLAFPEGLTVREVVQDMREKADEYSGYSIQYTYVVTDSGRLVGVLPLRDLLLKPGKTSISEIMIPNPLGLTDDATLDEMERFFDEHSFLGVPVVDGMGSLVGVVRRMDVEEALGERVRDDYLKTQGIVGGEELRSMPLTLRSRRRLSWLSVNILLNLVSASIIALYTETLESVIALAVFLPIISDMSGCSGNQSVAVSMRELTLGLVKPFEVVHVVLKEAAVGVVNGIVLGALLGVVSIFYTGNGWFGLVVGGAMALNTLVAVILGGVVPLVLKALKADPALASGPILTTVTDMCGFFFVLSFASALLPYLEGV
jgi:magnesium transporter